MKGANPLPLQGVKQEKWRKMQSQKAKQVHTTHNNASKVSRSKHNRNITTKQKQQLQKVKTSTKCKQIVDTMILMLENPHNYSFISDWVRFTSSTTGQFEALKIINSTLKLAHVYSQKWKICKAINPATAGKVLLVQWSWSCLLLQNRHSPSLIPRL